MRNTNIKKLAYMGLLTAVALLLSYVEAMLPPLFASIPGIKLGLANICIVFLLYRFGVGCAVAVSIIRVAIVSVLFGNPVIFIYSIVGAALSIAVMVLLKRLDFLSPLGVSVAGAISHNLGQVLVAIVLLGTAEIGYYMVVLAFTGTLSGIFVGLCAAAVLKYLPKNKF